MRAAVVTGGRDYEDYAMVSDVLGFISPDIVYVGDCPGGADLHAREWCRMTGTDVMVFEAKWEELGKRAGPIRNGEMLKAAGHHAVVLAFAGGRGTEDCKRQAATLNMVILEVKP